MNYRTIIAESGQQHLSEGITTMFEIIYELHGGKVTDKLDTLDLRLFSNYKKNCILNLS